MLARRPSETQASFDRDLGADQAAWGERYRRTLQSRRAAEENAMEELRGASTHQQGFHMIQQGSNVIPYVLPTPRPHSPLMSFSQETTRDLGETMALAPTTKQPRKLSTKLQRRTKPGSMDARSVRSREEEAEQRLQAARKHSLPPRPLSVHGLDPDDGLRPAIKSHFSFIGDGSPQVKAATQLRQTSVEDGRSGTRVKSLSLDRPLPAAPLPSTLGETAPATPPAIELTEPSLASRNASPAALLTTSPVRPSPSHASHSRVLQTVDTNRLRSEAETRPASALTLGDVPSVEDVRVARHVLVERRRLSQRLLEEGECR
jgi:hypothetical protein